MPQTTVAATLTVGAAGQLAEHNLANLVTDELVLAHATAVPFGCGVAHDATGGDGTCKLLAASTEKFEGVAYDNGSVAVDDTVPGSYSQYDTVPVLKKGKVYVVTEESVDPTKAVFCRYTANGGGKTIGQFRTDEDGGKAFVIANAQWRQTVTGAGTALLEINLP